MFDKFQRAVRNAYLDLKDESRLDFDRAWPSPGELKSWCLTCYVQGLNPDDERVFVRFFNREQSTKDLTTIIENFDLDRLRPLRNFIRGDTQRRPDENIVKLLAVLIDFKPRPYKAHHWAENANLDNQNNKGGNPVIPGRIHEELLPENRSDTAQVEQEGSIPEPPNQTTHTATAYKTDRRKQIERRSKNTTLLYAGSGLAIATLFFAIYHMMKAADCMCWNGVRYIAVGCQDKEQPHQIIGLNKNKLTNFQKITRPDTLTYADIGKVWYAKIDHKVEFFTYPRFHPVHHDRALKAATKRIIDLYAGENADVHSDIDDISHTSLR